MIQGELLRESTLHMSDIPLTGDGAQVEWGSLLSDKIMVVAAILLILLNLPNFFKIAASVIECMRIARANSTLEHSYNQATIRNRTAWTQLIPLALLADRFDLIHPAFYDKVPMVWHAPMTLGIILAYLLVRLIMRLFLMPRRVSSETSDTAHRILFTMAIALSAVALCTTGIMLVAGASDSSIRSVLIWETALLFFLSLIRTGQILGSQCHGFSTFLYLCALEMIPAACLIAATTIF